MSKRNLFLSIFITIVFITAIGIPTNSDEPGQESEILTGPNINMVSGTQLPHGDPWLQRQNEPSIAVSTRNPLHLLAGANDYRTVDMPIPNEEIIGFEIKQEASRDAWLGVFKSFDGGQTWRSGLLPGYPQDISPEGLVSPLKGFDAACDPVVRAGTNGLFFYSGIAFNRAEKSLGVIFVSRYIDNNNRENGDSIKYIDTAIIDQGNSGQFHDKPWIAVDIPRGGSGTVPIHAPDTPVQDVPAGNVYIAYSTFLGKTDVNIRSKILFARSTDCGTTWSAPIKLSESQHIDQGSTIAIDPDTGTIYVAWRRFEHSNQPGAIVVVKSADGGQTFTKPLVVTILDRYPYGPDGSFDQGTTPISFRTNSYPTMAVDSQGIVHLAWSQRGKAIEDDARILITRSSDGVHWTLPVLMDDYPGRGHEFMPSLTFAAGKLTMVWYDQRDDIAQMVEGQGWGAFIDERWTYRHTTDVYVSMADSGLNSSFEQPKRVSRYFYKLKLDDYGEPVIDGETGKPIIYQVQWNPPNLPLFKQGTTPFHGDYLDISPSPMFLPLPNGGWVYNSSPASAPIFHATWTDNRDVQPPLDGDWTDYTPPDSNAIQDPNWQSGVGCLPGRTGMRNQNVYTSRITWGLVAGSPGNTKPLLSLGVVEEGDHEGELIPRAFVVYLHNTTPEERSFRLSIANQPTDGRASFTQFGDLLFELDVATAPRSSVSRPVFAYSSVPYETIRIDIQEISEPGGEVIFGGLQSYVLLNPDNTNPDIIDPEGWDPNNPSIDNYEVHNPFIENPFIQNWGTYEAENPFILNPFIENYDLVNPFILNPFIENPFIQNPFIQNLLIINPFIENPFIENKNILNPFIENPFIENPSIDNTSLTDVTWTVENAGNTTSSYSFQTFSPDADKNGTLPGLISQILIYKIYTTPVAVGCDLREEHHDELVVNIPNPFIENPFIENPFIENPFIENPFIENATVSLAPGEVAVVTLRVYDPVADDEYEFDPGTPEEPNVVPVAYGHAANTEDALQGDTAPPISTPPALQLFPKTLNDGVTGSPYSDTLVAMGGTASYSWSLTSAPVWLNINLGTGQLWGTHDFADTYNISVLVTDSDGQTDTQDYEIRIAKPLNITTTSLPDGILGFSYDQTLTATGGIGDYTWSLESGSLPDGLSLNSGGVINGGAPTNSGTFSFTVEVTDTSNPPQTDQQVLSINVIPPHTVSMPNTPNGPTDGLVNESYLYSTGGSVCSWGDDVEYRFDWDDGNQSSWSTSTDASHSWDTAGTYNVTAEARCASDHNIVSGWSGTFTVTINEPDFEVVYVYSTDTTTANSYKDFLEGKGYPTSLIHMDSLVAGMFSDYGLILIGTDTGSLGTWGDSGKVDAINDSGKPIIGLGEGGYAFFGKLSLAIGWAHGWHGEDTDIIVVDSSHDVFNTPNNLGVTTGQTISVYTSTDHVGIDLPDPPSNVVLLGREVVSSSHYPLVQEDSRYLLWGWTASPDSMTVMGKDLFENVVNLMAVILFYKKDNWDVPGDLAGWRQNTTGTVLEVVNTGGNPGGYLSTQNATGYPNAGACTEKTELTDSYSSASTSKISFDLNVFTGNISTIHLRFRYKDATYNGWKYLLSNPSAMNVWNTYTVTFDPNWTDSEATEAGWTKEATSPSFSATMADVYYVEVRITSGGSMLLGIDNFRRLDLK